MDASCSIRLIVEQKRVFPTLLSHFPWRRGRNRCRQFKFSLAGLGVEKKDGESTTTLSGRIIFWEYGMKIFFDCEFFDEESFVHASFSLLQLTACFFTCFQ